MKAVTAVVARSTAAVGMCALLMGGGPAVATPADPVDPSPSGDSSAADTASRVVELQKKLTASRQRLEQVTAKAALATEKHNQAQAELAKRKKAAEAAQKQADSARAAAQDAEQLLHRLAVEVYMQGGSLAGVEALLSPTGTQDLLTRMSGAAAVASYRDRTLDDAKAALTKADDAQRKAAAAHVQQKAAALTVEQAFNAAKAEAEAATRETSSLEAEQTALFSELASLRMTSVDAEIMRMSGAEAEATRKALEEAMAAAGTSEGVAGANAAASAKALAFARSQLGKPYRWGGEGPDSWDCSGLTQAAWRVAGKSLTHYTGSQWQETARVALRDLQPGDLVFYGTAPESIHHVGMYVGKGMMIEAPRTGLNVRYAPIWRGDLIAFGGRP